MPRPSTPVIVSLVLTAAVVAWALAGIGGNPADCIPACDCEVIGSGSVRQPWNGWSSLAIVAAGIWTLGTAGALARNVGDVEGEAGASLARTSGEVALHRASRTKTQPEASLDVVNAADVCGRGTRGRLPDHLLGGAIVLSGFAALAAHSSVTAWAYLSDGAAIAALAWLTAALEWSGPRIALPVATGAAAAAWLLGTPAQMWITACAIAVFLAAQSSKHRARRVLPGIAAAALLGAGLALRALTDDGGPWCRADAPVPGHAIWHVVAAASLVCLVWYLRSGDVPSGSPEGDLRSGTATAPTGQD